MSDYVTKTNLLSALGRFKENTDDLYETKADANDLKNALQATNKRVTNLEQKAGDEIVVDYPSSTYGMDEVPANVAEYAKVSKLRGVTRGKNQLIKPLLASNFNSGYIYTSTLSNDGSGNLLVTSSGGIDVGINTGNRIISGHKYLLTVRLKASITGAIAIFADTTNLGSNITVSTADTFFDVAVILSPSVNGNRLSFISTMVSGTVVTINSWTFTDLTQYFSSDPSVDVSTLTISDIQTNYPELLIPSDYDAGSLVSTTYGGVESVGLNWCDSDWEGGYINTSGEAYTETDSFRTKNYLPILQCKDYYLYVDLAGFMNMAFYDKDKSVISVRRNVSPPSGTFQTPAGACYIKFGVYLAGSGWKDNPPTKKAMLSLGTTSQTWVEYVHDTLSLPSPVELRSAGSVHDEYDVESGVTTVRTHYEVFNGTENWQEYNSAGADTTGAWLGTDVVGGERQNITNNLGIPTQSTPSSSRIYGITQIGNNIFVTFPTSLFASWTDWVSYLTTHNLKLTRDLASPYTVEGTPILDPFLKVEGGGTIRPIQTQTTEIDSAMTAEYLSLGA